MNPLLKAAAAVTLSAVVFLGCREPLPQAVLEAGCERQVSAPFWKTWESKITATPGWGQLPESARKTLRDAAQKQFSKELRSEEGQRVMAECIGTYRKLENKAQLECVVDANLAKAGKAAIQECLKL